MASIYRHKRTSKDGSPDKTWYGRVTIDGRKRTKSLGTESRSLAQKRLEEWVEELKSTNWKDGKSYTFQETAARFVDEHFSRIKESSATRYAVSLKSLEKHLGNPPLSKITKSVLSEFETARRKEGVTNSTIRRDLACLAAMFRCAEEWEWFSGNPATLYLKTASRRGLTESEPRSRYLSHEEEELIIGAIDRKLAAAKSKRDIHGARMLRAAVILAIDTGLRREELMGLPKKDVDMLGANITVRAVRAKSNKMRKVPIHDRSLDLLDQMMGNRSQFVLHTLTGQRYSDLVQRFDDIADDLGLEDLRWHDLRRTCGCRLLQDYNMSIELVSNWLGHSSIAQTERAYAFLDVRHLQAHLKSVQRPQISYKNEDGTT